MRIYITVTWNHQGNSRHGNVDLRRSERQAVYILNYVLVGLRWPDTITCTLV